MPSDSNGNYALPGGYLAVGGDTILPSQHNPPLEDIGAGLTARLMRSGAGGMTGPLKAADGTVGAPSYTFGTALTSGFYKTTAGFGVSIAGTMVAEFGAGGLLSGVQTVAINDRAVTYPKIAAPSSPSLLLGSSGDAAVAVSAAANNGSGLIRLTTAAHTYTTGQKKIVNGVTGTTEANGRWTITVVDTTHIDLQGSTFTNAYVSGGTIGGGVTEVVLGGGLSMSSDTLSATIDPLNIINYIQGLEFSTAGSSSSFTIAPGVAVDRSAGGILRTALSITKTTSAWAVGSGNGGLDTGTIANSTWYYIFVIKRPDTGVVDILFSASMTPTLPTNYTLYRLVSVGRTNASGQWFKLVQIGNEFLWAVPVQDFSSAAAPSGNIVLTNVPPGFFVTVRANVSFVSTGVAAALINSPLVPGQTPNSPGGNLTIGNAVANANAYAQVNVMTDNARQVTVNCTGAGTVSFAWVTLGWYWDRSR